MDRFSFILLRCGLESYKLLVFTGFREAETAVTEEAKKSNHVLRKLEKRQQDRETDQHIEEQFGGGRLLAALSSRPGQCGRCDGYVITLSPIDHMVWHLI